MAETIIVNQQATIVEGSLKGFCGKVVGYSYMDNEVEIQLECDFGTTVIVTSEMIQQKQD
jgi:hypothetical protein